MAHRIREMRESDLPAVAELAVQLGYPVAVDDLAARFRSIAEEADHVVFVAVAEEDATIVGWVHVHGSRCWSRPRMRSWGAWSSGAGSGGAAQGGP